MQPRVVMLVDLDYFYAQCEEKRNPAIKEKPVVVCMYSGRSEDGGVVTTANYIARKYGVKSGIPIFIAKKKLEGIDAVFLPADFELYEQVSNRIMTIFKDYADRFEQVGIDEAYLDVSQKVGGDFEAARQLAQDIKNDLKAREGMTGSIGVGPNKLIAKIASDAQKPDGLTVIKPEMVEGFLTPLPVDRLIGVGKKTVEKMQTLEIRTIGELARYDVQRLIDVFGKSLGTYFHCAASGDDDDPVQERGETESVSRIATLKENTRELPRILEKTDELCKDVHGGLIQRGVTFKTVGIYVVMADMSVYNRSRTLESPTDSLEVLKSTVKELFERFLDQSELEVRRVGVRISGFMQTQKSQKSLTEFLQPPSAFQWKTLISTTQTLFLVGTGMSSTQKDEGRLPPGQMPIKRILRWGEDHPGITSAIPKIDLRDWVLVIDGEVEKPQRLAWEDFGKLPMVESVSDFHCVEGWSVLDCRWEGVRFRNIVDLVEPKKDAKYVMFECADEYTTSFALKELDGDEILLATRLDGKQLEQGLGFPLRLVVPSKYAYKSALWVTRIRFMLEKELGYWEKRGYSDTADVWRNDRFSR